MQGQIDGREELSPVFPEGLFVCNRQTVSYEDDDDDPWMAAAAGGCRSEGGEDATAAAAALLYDGRIVYGVGRLQGFSSDGWPNQVEEAEEEEDG